MKTHRYLVASLLPHGLWILCLLIFSGHPARAVDGVETNSVNGVNTASLNTQAEAEQGRFAIQAEFKGGGAGRTPAVYGAVIHHSVQASADELRHQFTVKVEAFQGTLTEVLLTLQGNGEIRDVRGAGLEDWSVRQGVSSNRWLVLRTQKSDVPRKTLSVEIAGVTPWLDAAKVRSGLTLGLEPSALAGGFVRLQADPGLTVQLKDSIGLTPLEPQYLPSDFPPGKGTNFSTPLVFRFQGTPYTLPVARVAADPEDRRVVLSDFRLVGQVGGPTAAFVLTARARVRNPRGATLTLLKGRVALTEWTPSDSWQLHYEDGRYVARFARDGDFPVQLKFNAGVQVTNGWNQIDFTVASSALQPVVLQGLPADTQFRLADGERPSRPERSGADFRTFLPAAGRLAMGWKEIRAEAEGALFFSVEEISQVTLRPGLMRQAAFLDFKVMQGEMNRVGFRLLGDGEIVRVLGPQVLSWTVDARPGSGERRLTVQFNSAQKDHCAVQIETQTPLGAFPLATNVLQIRPEGASRFSGYRRIVNAGAVRLEVLDATGHSQISPAQFPQTEAVKALAVPESTQVFAYRFSGDVPGMRVQADSIQPEVSVSQLVVYHLGDTELAIDAELELDVREAPLRELVLRVPKGYAVARIQASGLNDYFLTDVATNDAASLRLVYGVPQLGRQLVELRLEKSGATTDALWTLPRLDVLQAKAVRGHIAVRSDAGRHLTPGQIRGLTEIGVAFFPWKTPGIQAAFRVTDGAWQAALQVERLPQSVQADAFHLFSLGDGIAYSSTLVNYVISGAPMTSFRVALTNDTFNVEFTGKNVRNWLKTDGGYLVQLHTPVSGAYPLLVTYERPYKPQGETLRFVGAQPLDAVTEQGHSVVISTRPLRLEPVSVSPGLLRLEPAEVPAEYRLLFDAPILAAYRYTARPYDLQLELKPLVPGETIGQVIDRAALISRISKDGQVVTHARYLIKNRGPGHVVMRLPAGTQLWSVTVDGHTVTPVVAGASLRLPLPPQTDPNAVHDLEVKIASRSQDRRQLTVAAPLMSAPILLAEWKLEPEAGQRLRFRRGTLKPEPAAVEASGFASLMRGLRRGTGTEIGAGALTFLGLLACSLWIFRLATRRGAVRYSPRHVIGGGLGLIGFGVVLVLLAQWANVAGSVEISPPVGLRFVAAIQQPETALIAEVTPSPLARSVGEWLGMAWPAVLALVLWGLSRGLASALARGLSTSAAWTLLGWALLRAENGLGPFLIAAMGFVGVEVLLPTFLRWLKVRPQPPGPGHPPAGTSAPLEGAAAAMLVFVLPLGFLLNPPGVNAQTNRIQRPRGPLDSPVPESVIQQIRVQEDNVLVTATIRWSAIAGQTLPLLHAPGVLTRVEVASGKGRVVQAASGSGRLFLAEESGPVELKLQYQLAVGSRGGERGFALPTSSGLVNRITLTLVGLEADIVAGQAVSILPVATGSNPPTSYELVLLPGADPWIGWRPRHRDTQGEKAVFYAESSQLYVPGSGVMEGLHQVLIRPAQGELNELMFEVPAGWTVTDVVAPVVSLWRFDPSARRLRVGLVPAQSRPFSLRIRSQSATGVRSSEQSAGLLTARGAAGEVGQVGVATGSEIQLEDAQSGELQPLNLEDFPVALLEPLQAQVPGLTLRRAFRYASPQGQLRIRWSAVAPDVRVEGRQTLSLGEDRAVLAATLEVAITRAGIFKLSFVLPPTFAVESISGTALSHWTELVEETNRVITLHLKGRTEGVQTFALSLVAPGIRAGVGWPVPRLALREAGKQRGQLLIVPEQGLRLQAAMREGATPLDPLQEGVRQPGVLAFRLLQADWRLALDLERVEAWTQVSSLQQVFLNEAQVRVVGTLHYEIENAGLKELRVRLPLGAENVHFQGDAVADFAPRALATPATPATPATNAATRDWEIKLSRRISGKVRLQLNYQLPLPAGGTNVVLAGIEAQDVNLQRGFLTLHAASRLQVVAPSLPGALQPAEWQAISRELTSGSPGQAPDHTFRLVEPAFQLPLQWERHEPARLLPAHVNSVALTSVVSDDGAVLTRVQLALISGDQNLLRFTLPPGLQFWFAFVGQNSVWPWREQAQLLLPLEPHSRGQEPVLVELFYAGQAGVDRARVRTAGLELVLSGPRFDLPLENISWRVLLPEKWELSQWDGSLELRERSGVGLSGMTDLETYVRQEVQVRQDNTRAAEQFLSTANSLLQQGDPESARRAFQQAFGLSRHDHAFNEDARVQLHNLKTQQALVGLNVRQAKVSGESARLAMAPHNLRAGQETGYTQEEARHLIERNSEEDNAVQLRLVERLIQQQEATVDHPGTLRATLPTQGRQVLFGRTLQVETQADLRIHLSARERREVSPALQALVLLGILTTAGALTGVGWLAGEETSILPESDRAALVPVEAAAVFGASCFPPA